MNECEVVVVGGGAAGLSDLQGIELGDGTVIPRRAVFVRPRFVPNADLLADHRAG